MSENHSLSPCHLGPSPTRNPSAMSVASRSFISHLALGSFAEQCRSVEGSMGEMRAAPSDDATSRRLAAVRPGDAWRSKHRARADHLWTAKHMDRSCYSRDVPR